MPKITACLFQLTELESFVGIKISNVARLTSMGDSYTVIHVGDSCLIEIMTKQQLLEFINDSDTEAKNFLSVNPGDLINFREMPSGVLIIKGSPLIPTPVHVVTEYSL